jgi:pseudouridine-5'-phosphate glycosidase
MERYLTIRPHILEALAEAEPLVALESTVISHGLPRPRNLETAIELEQIIYASGAIPATIGIVDGRAVVGLSEEEIATFARDDTVEKASRRNLAGVLAGRGLGATTVAATMIAARAASIEVFATGGMGGVHRGDAMDVSADVSELGRTRVALVCSGPKAILDVPRTYEALETLGVPVVGYQTTDLPAFYSRTSGVTLDQQVDTAEAAAAIIDIQRRLDGAGGLVFVNPPPEDAAIDRGDLNDIIAAALSAADAAGIQGKDVTPFLLDHLAEASGGRTVETNIALLKSNAKVAARIAVAYAKRD